MPRSLAFPRRIGVVSDHALAINRSDSLATGLLAAYLPTGQGAVLDYTGQNGPYAFVSSGTNGTMSPIGQSIRAGWSTPQFQRFSALTAMSVSVVFQWTNQGVSTSYLLVKTYGFEIGVNYSSGSAATLYYKTYIGSGASAVHTTGSTTINLSQWYHLVIAQERGSGIAKVYLNGVYAFTVTPPDGTAPMYDSSYYPYFGSSSAAYIAGPVACFMFWDRGLTGQEISRLFASPLAMFSPAREWYAGVSTSTQYNRTYSTSSGSALALVRSVRLPKSVSSGSAVSRVLAIALSARSATSSAIASAFKSAAKSISVTSSAVAAIGQRAIGKAISSVSSGSAVSVSYGRLLFRSASAVSSAAVAMVRTVAKSAAASSGSAVALSRILSLARTVAATSAGSATVSMLKQLGRTYAATSGAAISVKRAISKTALLASSGAAATVSYGRILFRSALATSGSAVGAVSAKILARLFAVQSSASAVIGSRALSLSRAATSGSSAIASRYMALQRSIAVVSSSSPAVFKSLRKSFLASAGWAAVCSAVLSSSGPIVSAIRKLLVRFENRSTDVVAEDRTVEVKED